MEVAKQLAKLESVSLPNDCGNFFAGWGDFASKYFLVKYQISIQFNEL